MHTRASCRAWYGRRSLPPPPPFPPTQSWQPQVFQVDADDDIVVGDTIIFTERLYVDQQGKLIQGLGGVGGATVNASSTFPPRVSLSVASLSLEERQAPASPRHGRESSTPRPQTAGAFVGERTAAAHVLQDSFRAMRRREAGGVLEYNR